MKIKKKKEEINEIKEVKEIKKEGKVVVEENLEPIYHILKHGEDLQTIAEKFDTNIEKINELNGNITVIAGNQIRVK